MAERTYAEAFRSHRLTLGRIRERLEDLPLDSPVWGFALAECAEIHLQAARASFAAAERVGSLTWWRAGRGISSPLELFDKLWADHGQPLVGFSPEAIRNDVLRMHRLERWLRGDDDAPAD